MSFHDIRRTKQYKIIFMSNLQMIKASRHFLTHKNSNIWLPNLVSLKQPTIPFLATQPPHLSLSLTTSWTLTLWTFSKYRLSPQFMFKFLSNPNTGWEVISEKCQQCKCFNHCPIPQTQWKHMLVSSLTPYWPHLSCYHVTSHLNSPSKNVLSNYNILQDYNPNSHMSGRLKIHNWRRKYKSTFDY